MLYYDVLNNKDMGVSPVLVIFFVVFVNILKGSETLAKFHRFWACQCLREETYKKLQSPQNCLSPAHILILTQILTDVVSKSHGFGLTPSSRIENKFICQIVCIQDHTLNLILQKGESITYTN